MQGRVLAGRYKLISKLGEGGMGSVWRAEHIELGTLTAVKLIDPGIATNEEALARFKREAQAAATLRSPHVVQILDYGVDEGTPFIAMELLDGETLSARLERQGRLSPIETATVITHVARAVGKGHAIGIVHRDLKPDNIFIVHNEDDDLVKVLDFGIAKRTQGAETTAGPETHTGAMLGTPFYMSPEQAGGKKSVDHRTDIWAMAVIAFECITGRRPFDADTLGGLVLAICTEPLPIPSLVGPVPPGFDQWFAKGARRDITLRHQSVQELAAELRAICGLETRSTLASVVDVDEETAPMVPGPGGEDARPSAADASGTVDPDLLLSAVDDDPTAAPPTRWPKGKPKRSRKRRHREVAAASSPSAPDLSQTARQASPTSVTLGKPGKRTSTPLVVGAAGGLLLLAAIIGGAVGFSDEDQSTDTMPAPETPPLTSVRATQEHEGAVQPVAAPSASSKDTVALDDLPFEEPERKEPEPAPQRVVVRQAEPPPAPAAPSTPTPPAELDLPLPERFTRRPSETPTQPPEPPRKPSLDDRLSF